MTVEFSKTLDTPHVLDVDKAIELGVLKPKKPLVLENVGDLGGFKGWMLGFRAGYEPIEGFQYLNLDHHLIFPKESQAAAAKALADLTILRDHARDGWIPQEHQGASGIVFRASGRISTSTFSVDFPLLSFQTHEICREFLNRHIGLIRKARPLLSGYGHE